MHMSCIGALSSVMACASSHGGLQAPQSCCRSRQLHWRVLCIGKHLCMITLAMLLPAYHHPAAESLKPPMQFRGEISELMSSMIEAGAGLLMPEDRLLVLMEAAQVTVFSFGQLQAPYCLQQIHAACEPVSRMTLAESRLSAAAS